MTAPDRFRTYLAACPLIAILRGVRPEEVEAIGAALVHAGIRIIEVPLNSPAPFDSIARLSSRLGGQALIGAGTVLSIGQVAQVINAGGQLIVSPNTDAAVIAASVAAGLASAPGFCTPSEAFAALAAGAHTLKLFPAEAVSPAVLKAQRAVLPRNLPIVVVGGIKPDTMSPWRAAGADGFGLGSALYRPGQSADEVAAQARAFVDALAAS